MVLKRVIQQFAELGMKPIAGPELEFYVLERTDKNPTGWQRYGEATGNVYVAGLKGDPENVLLRTLRHLSAYGLEVVAANHEFSSGQFEINLWHSEALDAADRAFRFKSAIQELARQEDKLATFMAKPFNDEGGSGFHIHFSTWDDAGQPLFDDPKTKDGLSKTGKSAIAGVLAHAPALAAISNPTINSYKRFGPDTSLPGWSTGALTTGARWCGSRRSAARRRGWSFGWVTPAPTPISPLPDCWRRPTSASATSWSHRHRSRVMDTTRARQTSFLVILRRHSTPCRPTPTWPESGKQFVETFLTYKRNELERFHHWVTDWEFREYVPPVNKERSCRSPPPYHLIKSI